MARGAASRRSTAPELPAIHRPAVLDSGKRSTVGMIGAAGRSPWPPAPIQRCGDLVPQVCACGDRSLHETGPAKQKGLDPKTEPFAPARTSCTTPPEMTRPLAAVPLERYWC